MKNTLIIAAIVSLSLASVACKSSKNTSSSQATETTSATAEQTYRLIVSYSSKGAGTNAEKREALLKYVESHPKKPVYKEVLWGREGETDYCFTLKELSKKEQASFVEDIKKMMAGSDRVLLSENAVCPHQGR